MSTTQTDTEAGIAAYYEAIRQARKARRGRRTANGILGWNAPHITIKVEEPAK